MYFHHNIILDVIWKNSELRDCIHKTESYFSLDFHHEHHTPYEHHESNSNDNTIASYHG